MLQQELLTPASATWLMLSWRSMLTHDLEGAMQRCHNVMYTEIGIMKEGVKWKEASRPELKFCCASISDAYSSS